MTVVSDHSAHIGQAQGSSYPLRVLVTTVGAIFSGVFIGVCWFFYWFIAIPAAITASSSRAACWSAVRCVVAEARPSAVAFLTQTIDTFFPNYLHPNDVLREVARLVRHRLLRPRLSRLHADSRHLRRPAQLDRQPQDRQLVRQRAAQLHRCHLRAHLGGQLDRHNPGQRGADPAVDDQLLRRPRLQRHTAADPVPLRDHRSHQHPQPHLQSQARCAPRVRAQHPAGLPRLFRQRAAAAVGARARLLSHPARLRASRRGQRPRRHQSTMPYDRTSFLDFSRHAFWQGLDLVSGYIVIPYLRGATRRGSCASSARDWRSGTPSSSSSRSSIRLPARSSSSRASSAATSSR